MPTLVALGRGWTPEETLRAMRWRCFAPSPRTRRRCGSTCRAAEGVRRGERAEAAGLLVQCCPFTGNTPWHNLLGLSPNNLRVVFAGNGYHSWPKF